jgi:hypothetical protein
MHSLRSGIIEKNRCSFLIDLESLDVRYAARQETNILFQQIEYYLQLKKKFK